MSRKVTKTCHSLIVGSMLVMAAALGGCSGSDGAPGAPGKDLTASPLASVQPESCATCHGGAGYANHQSGYSTAMANDTSVISGAANYATVNGTKVGVQNPSAALKVEIQSVTTAALGSGTDPNLYPTTVVMYITENDQPYRGAVVDKSVKDSSGTVVATNQVINGLDQQSYNWAEYQDSDSTFPTAGSFLSSSSSITNETMTTDGAGTYTMVAELPINVTATAVGADSPTGAADIYFYFTKDAFGPSIGHIQMYNEVSNVGMTFGTWTGYTTAVDVAACEACHGKPYMKHGYRGAEAVGLPQFASCKNCHYDTRPGSDAAEFFGDASVTYTANIMTDVHASHMNVFPYPQSMANCNTCHAGHLAATLDDSNFTLATCETCHADVPTTNTVVKKPLSTVMPHSVPANPCLDCHGTSNVEPGLVDIHDGYNPMIYAAPGVKYSSIFAASVDTATYDSTTHVLDFTFSATKTDPTSATTLAVTDMTPSVEIGLYGYDTQNFLVSPHNKDIDTARNLEAQITAVGDTSCPRITVVAAANGQWEVKADLSAWASEITAGTVKRVEIGILPTLKNAAGTTVAINAPSKTFNLVTDAFDPTFYTQIVNVETGCNNCHDALATTFHSADRGGNIVICRLCHTVNNGASHLEMQSRSIDSYVHAIHEFQPFNPSSSTTQDQYNEEAGFVYPTFTLADCESCHVSGEYEVPDQTKRLPSILSASTTVPWTRDINNVPSYIVGPASRSCGSCHRAYMIKNDLAGALTSFNQHTKQGGYLIDITDNPTVTLSDVEALVMSMVAPQ